MSGHDATDGKEPLERWLTTGDMARLSQTTLRTVRFYESEGLIVSRERPGGSHRRFPVGELRKLRIISDLREAGLSLQEIKRLMALRPSCSDAASAAEAVRGELSAQLAEIERRVAALRRVRRELLALSGMLRVCQSCDDPGYPSRCQDCNVVSEAGAECASELLWKN